ncbi:hypothetical protein K2X92_02240 [Candidatus Gracilibacteria bacterium]|nr:hypothetical protein [Candidatus Gracilibacteria bacterium]
MQKKSVIVPIIAIIVIIVGVFATSGFPDTGSLPRLPTGPGTIGGVLNSWFETDGSAKNTNTLSGVSATGYLQHNNCTDPINNKWIGIDDNGRGICANGGAVLAGIAKFTQIAGTVEVLKFGSSVWTPANTTDYLFPGDFIRTDSSSTGTIQFVMDDSLIRLFTDTTLELQMGNLDGNSVAEAILSDGRLWGRILSSTGVNLGGGGVVTGVRGTSVDVYKTGSLFTITVTDSVNPVNTLRQVGGMIISSVKDADGSVIGNPDFGKGTRFVYMSDDVHNVKKITEDKNNFYADPWFRKNTRLDVKYMSDLLEGYSANPAVLPKKSRLLAELDTTIELNNTGTLVRLLQDFPALATNLIPIVNTLDEENNFGGESQIIRNIRKTRRFECKSKAMTFFPDLSDCKGSWNTLAITDFGSNEILNGKNSEWTYSLSGTFDRTPNDSGEYIWYISDNPSQILSKHISVTVDKAKLLTSVSNQWLISFNTTGQGVWHNGNYLYYGKPGSAVIKIDLTSGGLCHTALMGLGAGSSLIDVIVSSGNVMKLHSNGILIPGCSNTGTADIPGIPSYFMIGSKHAGSSPWMGTIHKIEIY